MQSKSILKCVVAGAIACGLLVNSGYKVQHGKVLQIYIGSLLNARPVTVLNYGKLIHWTKGVDHENGYLTTSAAKFIYGQNAVGLPDDPMIRATGKHPDITLYYDNKHASGNQAVLLADTGSFYLQLPKSEYKDLFVCLTSAYGKSKIDYELIYSDGTETKSATVPDWANDVVDNDPDFSYLVHDLPKWSNIGKETEPNHHNIHAWNLHPDQKRSLIGFRLKNNSKTYVLLWALTGVQI